MPISADFTIDLTNRLIYHSSGTAIYSVNELYSWLQDYFDESTTIDDTIPMSAQTPTAYSLLNGWMINEYEYASFEYLTGGSIKTLDWNADSYDYGIRILTFGSDPGTVTSDIGKAVGYNGGTPTDSGTLLDFTSSAPYKWYVRVDDTSDTFANTVTAVEITSGTGTGTLSAASTTGESIWANPYTLGTLEDNTQIYLIQDESEIIPWWSTGQVDIIIKVQEADTLIDEGYVTIMARQYTKLYDHFISDLSAGARTPIPVATFSDTNNTTGYRTMNFNNGSVATLQVGEIITDDADANNDAIVTAVTGAASATGTIEYYLIGYPLTDFSSLDNVTAQTSGKTFDVNGAPSNNNPPVLSGITFTFGATSQDLNNGEGNQPYDVIINANNNSLANLYEYLKYVTRYGSTESLNGNDGEQYIAVGEQYITYTTGSGTMVEGNTVTGDSSGATATIVSNHTGIPALVVRNIVGEFESAEGLTEGSNTGTITGIEDIAATKQSPFGTYAGGKFFGARGVWLSNVPGADASNYELIDSTNTRRVPPTTVAVTINNTESGDKVSVFPTTGLASTTIDKSQFTSHATNNTSGSSTFEVTTSIPSDTPSSGVLRVPVRNASGNIVSETRYSYSSWSGSIFSGVTPTLVTTYDANDTAYVPYIDEEATGTSVSTSLTYVTDRNVLTRVRIVGIQPFSVTGQITSSGLTVQTIRASDSIYQ